jgi:sugar phosphate isomerase/epimerase
MPRFSISQISTLTATFAEDVEAYRQAGADGIGVWEVKLPEGEDAAALEAFEKSGLGSAAAVPLFPSILPLPHMEGPADPQERVDTICRSIHRLARFRPSGIVCLTGPAQGRGADDARSIVVDGLRTIAGEAERAGVRVGLEPINRIGGENWTTISSIPDAVEILDDVGHPALGLQLDTWHLWNTETLLDDIGREAHRFVGVHLADWREPTRGWCDRVLPGDGTAGLQAIVGALEHAGWNGLYDLEIFSDNGTFGNAWPDSLWDVPAGELARRGRRAFDRVWEERIRVGVDRVSPGAF